MSTQDEPADQFQGDQHKNKPSSNELADPDAPAIKKGKSSNSSSSKAMSPARQVMKAITHLALNPKQKSVPKKVKSKGQLQEPGARASSKVQVAQGQGSSSGEDSSEE